MNIDLEQLFSEIGKLHIQILGLGKLLSTSNNTIVQLNARIKELELKLEQERNNSSNLKPFKG